MGEIAAESRLGVSADEMADDAGVLDRRLERRADVQRAVAPRAHQRRFVARVDADQPRAVRLGQIYGQTQTIGRVLAGVEIDQDVFVGHLPAPRFPRLLAGASSAPASFLTALLALPEAASSPVGSRIAAASAGAGGRKSLALCRCDALIRPKIAPRRLIGAPESGIGARSSFCRGFARSFLFPGCSREGP